MDGIVPIGGPETLGAASSIHNPVAPGATGSSGGAAPMRGQDHVELSEAAQQSASQSADEVRMELVQQVQADIAAGLYETPEKIDAAVDALLGELTESQLRLSEDIEA